jgi:hypothetical protein
VKAKLASVKVDRHDYKFNPYVGCVSAYGMCKKHGVAKAIAKKMNKSLNMDIPPHGLKH